MNTVDRYIELRKQLLEIETELESLKPEVAAHLRAQGGLARTEGYELQLRTYQAWDYSPEVASLQLALNEAKRHERLDGRASVRETRDMLVFRSTRPGGREVREMPDEYADWEADEPAAQG